MEHSRLTLMVPELRNVRTITMSIYRAGFIGYSIDKIEKKTTSILAKQRDNGVLIGRKLKPVPGDR